ncbi:MAG: ABC transporter permease, partial [Rubricoccaceae bacterium]|nr:ABC transporter permease [Rubricoccaceae bacterium]
MRRSLALVTNGLRALRQSPLHSLLSILGLVIGVAALVAILSLVDGVERYAREQIERETDYQSIGVVPIRTETIDGITVRRDSIPVLSLDDVANLRTQIGDHAVVAIAQRRTFELPTDTSRTAAMLVAASVSSWELPGPTLKAGRLFDEEDQRNARPVVVLSDALASRLAGENETASLVGDSLVFGDMTLSVIGVLEEGNLPAMAAGPFSALVDETSDQPPALLVRVELAENITLVADEIRTWLDDRFDQGQDAFTIQTNAHITEQLRQGILLFKVIMGLITGISVLVGGVGVMNVLLMTVTER